MKSVLLLLTLLCGHLAAADLITEPLPTVAAPDWKTPLDATWKIAHGSYEPKDGVLVCAENPENKHVAVIWHQVGWNTGVMEFEFRLDGAKSLILGCDGTTEKGLAHIGRVVVTPKLLSIAEDSVKPSRTLAKEVADLSAGEWHKLRFEWKGDQIALRVDGVALQAQFPYLATAKTRSWIAVGGQTASIRALKISGK